MILQEGFFSLTLQIQMKALFKYLPVVSCTAGYSVLPELPAATFFPTNSILAFWLLPSNIHSGPYISQSELCLLPFLIASSSHTALSGATQRSHPRTTPLQLMLCVSGMTYISEYFHTSTMPCVGALPRQSCAYAKTCLPTEIKVLFTGTISKYVFLYIGKIRLLYYYNKHPYISIANRTSQSVVSAAITSFVGAIIVARVLGQSSDFDRCICRGHIKGYNSKTCLYQGIWLLRTMILLLVMIERKLGVLSWLVIPSGIY